jgi:clan AA aspartic protease (TIGR02281 family)
MAKEFIFAGFLIFSFLASQASADTVYLKNGRSIEGLIVKQDTEGVELEVGSGTIRFMPGDIERVSKGSTQENNIIKREWEKKKEAQGEKAKKENNSQLARKENRETRPVVPFRKIIKLDQHRGGRSFVDAVINNKVHARLQLDTGASTVLLYPRVSQELGLEASGSDETETSVLADGRSVENKSVVLESVNVGGAVAENVPAAVALKEPTHSLGFGTDGLLGMSFLENFNFKIDEENDILILENKEAAAAGNEPRMTPAHTIVEAVLNGRVRTQLVLDTGAAFVQLPWEVGRQLGIESKNKRSFITADGHKQSMDVVLLESLSVEGVEAKNVAAAILPPGTPSLGQGLLGQSFLKNFNYRIDQKTGKLILERTRSK